MNASYENDPGRGPGYGLFRLSGLPPDSVGSPASDGEASAGATPAGPGAGDVRYAVLRSGDHKSLHLHSWEDSECRLVPDSVEAGQDGLVLRVGPDVVAQLDELNTYRFALFLPDGPHKAPLELSGIVYPPVGGRGSVAVPPPPPAPASEPASVPEPEPGRLELAPVPAPAPAAPSRLPLVLGLLAALAVAGAAVWHFALRDTAPDAPEGQPPPAEQVSPERASPNRPFSDQPSSDTPSPAETRPKEPVPGKTPSASSDGSLRREADPQAAPKASAGDPAPPAAVRPDPEVAVPAPAPSSPAPLDEARALLRGGGDAARALELGRRLAGRADHDAAAGDAAFLLYQVAAEGGMAEAMLGLAGFYDPADAAPKGSIVPDPEQAWYWYGKAEQAGQAGAGARKAALRARLEQEAAAGSAESRALLGKLR